MRYVRAPAGVVDGAKSSRKRRSVREAVDLLCTVTDRLMSVGKVARIQMHVLQVAVIGEGQERRSLPDGVVKRKLDFTLFVFAAELGKGADG